MGTSTDNAVSSLTEVQATNRTPLRTKNFIGGQWCDALSGKTQARKNPANYDEAVGYYPASDRADAKKAIEAAQKAFPGWRKMQAPHRARILEKACHIMEKNAEEFATHLTWEQGKPLREARGEIVRGLEEAYYVVGEGTRIEGRRIPSSRLGTICYTTREPLGVVSAIIPWNYPFIATIRKVAPALVFGNTVVLKPAGVTPFSCANIVRCFAEAGLPDGVFNLVTGPGSTVGAELTENVLVKGITFTGSTLVGKDVARAAAEHNCKLQLEMGGKNPAIVFEGVDLRKAATEITAGALACAGQRCTSISRVIVQRTIAKELVALLKAEMEKVVVADGFGEKTTMGPLVTEDQLQTVMGYIQKALDEKATLVSGGKRLAGPGFEKGWFVEPTLFSDVTPESTLAREEVFGPVLAVLEFQDLDEALEIGNAVAYGLAACAYTPRIDQALAFLDRIEAGMTQVNMPTYCDAHAPFGGVKDSGLGAYSIGYSNVEFFTNMKAVYIQA